MDMPGMTMPVAATTAASATPSSMPPMSGGNTTTPMMSPSGCKISMLWNWNTIDACFLSTSWRITSQGAFAGLCIGVIVMVIALEALRKFAKYYDQSLLESDGSIAESIARAEAAGSHSVRGGSESTSNNQPPQANGDKCCQSDRESSRKALLPNNQPTPVLAVMPCVPPSFRPNVYQQAVRALIHTAQFALAYLIMLLAMYYNGYIIICIIIGAFIGSFLCSWDRIGGVRGTGAQAAPANANEITGCCG